MIRFLLVIALSVAAAWYYFGGLEKRYPPGVLVTEVPKQTATSRPAFNHQGILLTPMAAFELDARVLSAKRYSDEQSALSPIDLALGWQALSDQAVLDELRISQVYRFWQWHTRGDRWPVPRTQIEQNGSNMHLIPSNEVVWKQLKGIRRGDLVYLRGYLVNSRWPNGRVWNSSLSRADTGNGACELFWVESMRVRD